MMKLIGKRASWALTVLMAMAMLAGSASRAPASRAAGPVPHAPASGAATADSSRAHEPELYLSWNAPFGSPRATQSLSFACGDTSKADTLYLCIDPAKDSRHFNGFTAAIDFHAASGDSLAPFWMLGSGAWGRLDHARVAFRVDSGLVAPQPWRVSGAGFARFTHTHGSGSLEMIFAVDTVSSAPVKAGTIYCLAQVVIQRNRADRSRCDQPLCVEWSRAELAFWIGDAPLVKRGAHRFVSINSPGGSICGEFRRGERPEPWRPH